MTAPSVGEVLPSESVHVTRADLVRYCGASGDHNTIHWSQRHASAAGLPDVIAHGMLTMGLAARVVHAWSGDPGRTVDLSVRFSSPVPVPDTDDGALVTFSGVVEAVDEATVTIALEARLEPGGVHVLQRARAVVRRA